VGIDRYGSCTGCDGDLQLVIRERSSHDSLVFILFIKSQLKDTQKRGREREEHGHQGFRLTSCTSLETVPRAHRRDRVLACTSTRVSSPRAHTAPREAWGFSGCSLVRVEVNRHLGRACLFDAEWICPLTAQQIPASVAEGPSDVGIAALHNCAFAAPDAHHRGRHLDAGGHERVHRRRRWCENGRVSE